MLSAQSFQALFSGISLQNFSVSYIVPALPIVIAFLPLVLAICLIMIFWNVWVRYINAEFFYNEKTLVLEIRLPKETMKSPAAMELFLTALHQTGKEGNWYDKYWLGRTRDWFSLELVSIEGQVHFFIWTRASMKSFIESSLYAQFPGIEVHETDDYAKSLHFDIKTMTAWGCELKYTKGNPYPIKTYVDYGLDKDPKEEFKVDPLSPLLEFLGSVGANQQVWIQIIVRAHKDDQKKSGLWFKTVDLWKEETEAEVGKLLNRDPKTKVAKVADDSKPGQRVVISEGEKDAAKAIERAFTKLGYDVGIRAVYIANRDSFVPATIGGILGSFKQFNSQTLNGFRPNGDEWSPSFSYPWQDFREKRQNVMREELIETYKRRSYFYPPHKGEIMVMNSEELATIFHFPGQVAATPTLARVASKKGQAPANLPI